MTLEEEMSLAVIKGEKGTALVLAQFLIDQHVVGAVERPALNVFPADKGRVRVALMISAKSVAALGGSGLEVDWDNVRQEVNSWVEHGSPLLLIGFDKLFVFEIPEVKGG